jgi:hypothetical protein
MTVPDEEDKSPPRAVVTGDVTPADDECHVAAKS